MEREHRSWRGKETPQPSNAECAETCRANAEEARAAEANLRVRFQALAENDSEHGRVVQALSRARADIEHWEGMARWYDGQPVMPVPALPPVPRVSRIVGEDDGDDVPASAWAETGYAR